MRKWGAILVLFAAVAMVVPMVYAFELDLKRLGDALKGVTGKKSDSSAQGLGLDLNDVKNVLTAARISEQDEIRIGREIAGNLLGVAPLVEDAALQQYVNKVGRWVASQSERPDLPWRFGVIDSTDINAFAAPGGHVLITKGLYRLLDNEAQLAGVLGHEIGHVVRKHHLDILQKSSMIDIGKDLVKDRVGGGDVIKNLIGNGAEICARGLDKNAEYEADRIGMILAARAGYDPYGLADVLQAIGHVAKDSSSIRLLFKTHPLPDDRLLRLGEAMGERLDTMTDVLQLRERFYRLKN
ncbi:MAG: M48 family metalloprotease [Methylophilaceae bacterium]|nr:M48 family metalloprotease [Methylophilaceae bacterium]